MLEKTFFQPFDDTTTLEVRIYSTLIKNIIYFYAQYVNTNISDELKKSELATYTEETNGKIIYYKNLKDFESALKKALTSNCMERLKSEI